jgi:glycosyltransferase involved in cell wall biosynthesis
MSARQPTDTHPGPQFSAAELHCLPKLSLRQPRRIRRLNIGLLIPTLQSGGAERVCSLLANHWARAGHHVTLMTFSDPASDAFVVSPFVNRVVLGGSNLTTGVWRTAAKNLARLRAVRGQIQESELDVTLSFMSVSNTLLALAGRGLSTACIGAERTYPPAMPLPKLAEWARWGLYGWLDAVVGLTDDSGRWLEKNTRAKTVAVIPNPVELPLESSAPFVDPKAVRCPGSRLMLAVGRLSEEKQFGDLIRAFCKVSEKLMSLASPLPWQLIILGEGPQRATLLKLIEQLGAQGTVLLPGRAGNVADWYVGADAFALTSSFEGYPNGLLEALAHGVPSVAFDCLTGPRELIRDGVNGLLVKPNSALDLEAALGRVMSDSSLRAQLARQSEMTVNAHAIDGISKRWEAVFAQAMASRGLA